MKDLEKLKRIAENDPVEDVRDAANERLEKLKKG